MAEEETVSVPKSEMAAILQQVADLTKVVSSIQGNSALNAEPTSVRRRKDKKVTIATVDGQPVVGMKNRGDEFHPMFTWTESDPKNPKREILYCDLEVRNMETNELEVIERTDYMQFMSNGGKQDCLVIKPKGEEWEKENGVVTKRVVPEGDKFSMEDLDIQVPDVVLGTTYTYVVDFNGKALEVHENYVNILK